MKAERASARLWPIRQHGPELLRLAWPLLVSQSLLIASGVADAAMAGNYGTDELAAISLGAGFWGTLFATLFGVVQGLGPIVARQFGANQDAEIGRHVRAGALLALLLSVPGVLVLTLLPEPLLRAAGMSNPALDTAVDYVFIIAWALPAALLVRVFYVLAASVQRPRPIVLVNASALMVKLPLSFALMHGLCGLPEMGLSGCAYGTLVMFVLMALCGGGWLFFDKSYRRFRLLARPRLSDWRCGFRVLTLGIPIGVSQLLEIGSLTVMAFAIARLGTHPTAAHQILASVTGLMFMAPMALGVSAQTLIANAIGRGTHAAAREIARASLGIAALWSMGACSGLYLARSLVLGAYTADPEVDAIALSVFPVFMVYLFFDAIQIVTASALRGYEQTFLPSIIYLVSLWGIGVLGGYGLTHGFDGMTPLLPAMEGMGIMGMWLAGAVSLAVCAQGLHLLLRFHASAPTGPPPGHA